MPPPRAGSIRLLLLIAVAPMSLGRAETTTRPAGVDPHEHYVTLDVDGPQHYEIRVGGTMDAENTHVYGGAYEPVFQPNLELTITNVGDRPIQDPRISINHTGDWFDMDALVAASAGAAPDATDEARSYALWQFCRTYIDAGPGYDKSLWGDTRSFVRFMNCFSSGACGTFHIVMPFIGHAAGLETDSGCLADCSHAVQRVHYGGDDHFFDALIPHGQGEQPRGYVPLELDNRTVADIDSLMADHYLVERCGTWPGFFINVSYFGPNSSFHPTRRQPFEHPRTMGMTLRPDESIRRTWTPVSRGWKPEVPSPVSSGQVHVIFKPRLTDSDVARDAVRHKDLRFEGNRGVASGPGAGSLVYEMYCPYVVIGAAVRATLTLPEADPESARILRSFDGKNFTSIWQGAIGGRQKVLARRDKAPEFQHPNFTHRVWFLFHLPAGAKLSEVELQLTGQAYIPSLPSLRCGVNKVTYRDATSSPHPVCIEHRWRESSAHRPPEPPGRPVSPKHESEAGFCPTFEWTAPEGEIESYEIYVSPREDLAWPVLAPFHRVLPGEEPRYTPPVVDALNDGQRYYWRVRARGAGGVWSEWSKTWSFKARGPGQPREVEITVADGRETLTWGPPRRGRPVERYEIYASADGALSPRRENTVGRVGKKEVDLPASLLAVTTETSFDVTNRPEVFYRVVAVDKAGSRSVPSPIVAASRPVWLPATPPAIEPGKPYAFTPPIRRSTGRWVLHLRKGLVRHDVDKMNVKKIDGPNWLEVDELTGELTGTAPEKISTRLKVTLEATIEGQTSARDTFHLERILEP